MELKAASTAQEYDFANTYNELPQLPDHMLIVHQDFKTVDLDKYQPNRRRMGGLMETIDIDSFFNYVKKRQAEMPEVAYRTFVDASQAKNRLHAKTILNFGTSMAAGQADDVAQLVLQKDPLFEEFLETFEGETFTAVKFADAFEDLIGSLDMVAFVEKQEQSIASAISVIRNSKVDAAQNTTVKATQYTSESSEMERVEIASNAGQLPTFIAIKTPIYLGLEEQKVFFKVKAETVSAGENKLKLVFSLKPIGLLAAYLKAGRSFQDLIKANLDPETVTIGAYTKL